MKSLLFIFTLCLIGISYAELPDTLKDPATREVAEYLDAKAQAAERVTRNFAIPTATTTFAGAIDIGIEIVSPAACGIGVCTATCTAPKLVISGGCSNTNSALTLYRSEPTANRAGWLCGYNTGGTTSAIAICGRLK